jgi:hypothetical protein
MKTSAEKNFLMNALSESVSDVPVKSFAYKY